MRTLWIFALVVLAACVSYAQEYYAADSVHVVDPAHSVSVISGPDEARDNSVSEVEDTVGGMVDLEEDTAAIMEVMVAGTEASVAVMEAMVEDMEVTAVADMEVLVDKVEDSRTTHLTN
ncbi:unnamed protein product [Allacma fusca]|uniref:Uncharacterized protein n=1 Tax=Allacma fusca TaxID=39272 RepID=A0A8J2LN89_9HEXA|nr:unnamed protein product [Allacma fusca]